VRSQQGRDVESGQQHSITRAASTLHVNGAGAPSHRGRDAIYSVHDTQEESLLPPPGRILQWRSRNGLTVRLSPGHLDGAEARKCLSLLEWWPGAKCDSARKALIVREYSGRRLDTCPRSCPRKGSADARDRQHRFIFVPHERYSLSPKPREPPCPP
jgi:hypothetical protein